MNNLVGRSFVIADGHYRIVDVRKLGGDAMVYAERLADVVRTSEAGSPRANPVRMAFHYGDIAPLLEVAGRA